MAELQRRGVSPLSAGKSIVATVRPHEVVVLEVLYVTVHPDSVAPTVLKTVGVVAVMGETPTAAIDEFCQAAGVMGPSLPATKLEPGEALVWPLCWNQAPFALDVAPLPCSGRA